jgi:undecaprenyl-diphosphatase
MEFLLNLDKSLFLFLNSLHTPFFDHFFYTITNTWVWVPLYVFILFLTYKKWGKKTIVILILLIGTVFITDQTCNVIKSSTERLRPSRNSELVEQIHLYQKSDGTYYKAGKYSFPSAHAANSMLFAIFVIIFIAEKRKWIIGAAILWSLMLGYSRIYLGVHYPIDVISGFTLGLIVAYPLFYFGRKWVRNIKM